MSDRVRYIVAYDIRDTDRLRRTYAAVRAFGYRLQYSVYVCDLTASEVVGLKEKLRDVCSFGEDSVVFIDLGPSTGRGETCFEYLGRREELRADGQPTIV